jgi:ABC-2 type transport system ATP-binding protein
VHVDVSPQQAVAERPVDRLVDRSMRNGSVIDIEHVTKRYGKNLVLDDLSFRVRPGRVTGFLGPNGAGKSTLMKILLDLAAADRGRATIGGTRYRDLPNPTSTVGVVLEPNAFHPGRTARDHLKILADASGVPFDRVEEMLELVELAHAAERRVGAYSLGMRQRLSLAGALLGDPPVLVLDEPANGLDPQGIHGLRDLLRGWADAGGTVFLSSHLLSELELLADEIVVIHRGRLVTSGTLEELQAGAVRIRSASPQTLKQAFERAGADVRAGDDDVLTVRGLSTDTIGDIAFASGVAVRELCRDADSLEQLFLGWTSDRTIDVRDDSEAN